MRRPAAMAEAARSFGVLVLAAALGEEILGDLAQHFARGGIAWLHHHRVQSPEAILDEAEQGAPAEPAQGENESEDQNRPDADGERGDAVRQRAHPIGDGDRGETEQQPWYDEQQRPGHEQLGQADLDEEAAGKRQHGVLLGARHVGFDVAAARVDERLPQRSVDYFGSSSGSGSRDFGVPDRSVAIHLVEG